MLKNNMKRTALFFLSLLFCVLTVCPNVSAAPMKVVYLECAKKCFRSDLGIYDSVDRTKYYPQMVHYYEYGYPDAYIYTSEYFLSPSNFINTLKTGSYIFISTHGSNGSIATYDKNGYKSGTVSSSFFNGYSSDAFENVKLCVLLACESAKGTTNVCKTLYNKGVQCVVGFDQSIVIDTSLDWQKYFAEGQSVGWSVEACIRYADQKVYKQIDSVPTLGINWGWLNSHVVYGNSSIRYTED